ncbi:MAG: glycoside hydrolase family 9 protein, partial [Pontiellaceae bacterium]|nr:glycoside hydrolase family 9 protein [Pontiellaceae bacterium]
MKRRNISCPARHLFSRNHGVSMVKIASLLLLLLFLSKASGQSLSVNDQGYFEMQGVNVFVFNNEYNGGFFDEKTAGIELIHHGVRTATGGGIRLQHTPEQWDLVPQVIERSVDREAGNIDVVLEYSEYDFRSRIYVESKGKGVEISVILDDLLPEELEGHAGFNLEFLPASYFGKTYINDGMPGIFPRYPAGNTEIRSAEEKIPQFSGHNTFDDRGRDEFIVPKPLARGNTLVLAPEDPEHMVKVECADAELMLFDGRNLAQNGWFIVRSLLPAGKTGKVLTWYVEPHAIPDWIRKPVIGYSQVGYVPQQEKIAVIELDRNDTPLPSASLIQVTPDGKQVEKLKGDVKVWGTYFRYNYAKFDFSSVRDPGIYLIQYGDQKTSPFQIRTDVYEEVWHPTLDVWFPVQMDHMQVNEAYRTWHGIPYLDDCLQAPTNHQHFDGYRQGPTTGTRYKPLERIPGMAVGGWFDAGDFDIQTARHNAVILSLVESWEVFRIERDETYIDQETRYVDIHRPDGQPDVLQQIEHGTLNLVAQVENIGHPVRGIIVPNLHQYHHLGDASTETDNLPYNPALEPYETDGVSSGTLDDRWAFTDRSSSLDYQTAGSLAAASRALKGYNDELAEKCLTYAKKLLNEADEASGRRSVSSRNGRGNLNTLLQLFITTGEQEYADRFLEQLWPTLERSIDRTLQTALLALPHMDEDYKARLREYVVRYRNSLEAYNDDNPYGVPISTRSWGGSSALMTWGLNNYYAHKAYPDLIDAEYVYRGLNYIFGCHPYSNLSFVMGVGTESKK